MKPEESTAQKRRMTRRSILIGAAAVLGGLAVLGRRTDRGGVHSDYFKGLSQALREAGVAQPALVIDRARLDENIAAARRTLTGTSLSLRVVVKSLPAIGLIEAIAGGLKTQRFMVFNGSMLHEMAQRTATADLLLGKPLPVTVAAQFYARQLAAGAAFADPQWLIDTPQRLQQYAALARELNRILRVSIEIDVGLHRGGVPNADDLDALLQSALAEKHIAITGLMGYDAHVPRVPLVERAYRASQRSYSAAIDVLRTRLGTAAGALFLNAAGSPTYAMHAAGTVANEVSVGSAFVKPTDFDIETLSHHVPAAFIATPVIKALERSQIPGIEWLSGVRRSIDPNTQRAFYIHGGHWLARPESPPGLQFSDLVGRSSNQELLLGSQSVGLQPDDYLFFRPTQSEAVLLQFGDLLVYDNGRIVDRWPTFPVSA